MKNWKTILLLSFGALVLLGVTTRPQWAVKDAFVVTCAVGVTSFPSVVAKQLVITVRSTATNPVWIGPDGGTAVGDGIQLGDALLQPLKLEVSKNANELDCIRDGAADVDLTVIVHR